MKNLKSKKIISGKAGIKVFKYWLAVSLICGVSILSIAPVSCRMTEEGIEIVPGDKTCPVVENFEVTGSGEFSVTCSEKIIFSSLFVAEGSIENQGQEIPVNDVAYDETGKTAQITLSEETQTGGNYFFSAVITDTNGNSTEFQQDFTGYNGNPAVLILSEICVKQDADKLLSDFVEFYCLKSGNTYGLKLCSGAKGADFDYYFPSMEVEAGEYIVLHNRIYDAEKAFNELEDDFALSKAKGSADSARDLWREGTDGKIGQTADVLVLKNYPTGKIYDGLPYCKLATEKWSKTILSEYAESLFSENVWTSGSDAASAFKSDNSSSIYRSFSRKNVAELAQKYSAGEITSVQSSADDWALTDKTGSGKNVVSGATPGLPNSTNYFSAN